MTQSQIEIYRGNRWEDVLNEIQKEYEKYDILETKTIRKFPRFWEKEYEVKISGMLKPQKETISTTATYDAHRDAILSMLEGKTDEPVKEKDLNEIKKTTEDEKDIEGMKKMIEKLVNKLEVEKKSYLDGDNERVLKFYFEHLIETEVDKNLAQQIMNGIKKELNEEHWLNRKKVQEALESKIKSLVKVNGELDLETTKIIALIGPTGVGKTTTLAKIAGILMSNNKRIGMITTDVYRIGATEQLQIYANILDSKMIAATSPEELKDAIDYFKNVEKVDQILIDTVGRSPMDVGLINDVKTYLDIAKPDHTGLVLSSTQKYSDITKILKNFNHVKLNSVLFTKLDETMSYGPLLNVVANTEYKLSFITDGQNVPQDIYLASPENIANKILTGVSENGSSSFTA
jgi:flagellar biosynthesis protein FlhF